MKTCLRPLVILALVAGYSHAWGGNQLMEYSIAEAMAMDETKKRLGEEVKFYFGERPAHIPGRVIAVSKVLRKTMRDDKASTAYACHWAFLSSMLKIKEEALKRNSRVVVNVASNHQNNVILSREKYQCSVGAVVVAVALKGELMEPGAVAGGGAGYGAASGGAVSGGSPYQGGTPYQDGGTVVSPVDMGDAILTPEPVIIRGAGPASAPAPAPVPRPQSASPYSAPAAQQHQAAPGRPLEERLRTLRQLYEAGEIDQATYEAQRQKILDSI